MNMFKKKDGFTLVELIVVIAILAILAGVAVPAYTGYINKAEEAADMQILSSVNTAVQGLAAAEGVAVTGIQVTVSDAGAVSVAVTPATAASEEDILALTGTLDLDAGFSATWADGEWTITK